MLKADDLSILWDADFKAGLPEIQVGRNPVLVLLLREDCAPNREAKEQVLEWYAELPCQLLRKFYHRLRTYGSQPQDDTFCGAVWELYVHHLVKNLPGVDMEEYEPSDAPKPPDYRVRFEGRKFDCEAYLKQPDSVQRKEDTWFDPFQRELKPLLTPGSSVCLAQCDPNEDPVWAAREIAARFEQQHPSEDDEVVVETRTGGRVVLWVHSPNEQGITVVGQAGGAVNVPKSHRKIENKIENKTGSKVVTDYPFILFLGEIGPGLAHPLALPKNSQASCIVFSQAGGYTGHGHLFCPKVRLYDSRPDVQETITRMLSPVMSVYAPDPNDPNQIICVAGKEHEDKQPDDNALL